MTGPDVALTESQIMKRLESLTGWTYSDDAIHRQYKTDGWRGSMLVANAIGFICEAASHHADVLVTFPKVSVALSTHSAGGITAKDFEVATLIERQVLWTPGDDSELTGPEKPFVRGE